MPDRQSNPAEDLVFDLFPTSEPPRPRPPLSAVGPRGLTRDDACGADRENSNARKPRRAAGWTGVSRG